MKPSSNRVRHLQLNRWIDMHAIPLLTTRLDASWRGMSSSARCLTPAKPPNANSTTFQFDSELRKDSRK